MKAKIKSTGETVNVHEDINGDFVTEAVHYTGTGNSNLKRKLTGSSAGTR